MTNFKSAHLFPKQKFRLGSPVKQPYYDKPTTTLKHLQENVLRIATDRRMSGELKLNYVKKMFDSYKLENDLKVL